MREQRAQWKAGSPFFFRQESQARLRFGFEDMEVQIKGVTDRVRPPRQDLCYVCHSIIDVDVSSPMRWDGDIITVRRPDNHTT